MKSRSSDLLPDYWTKGHMHPSGVFAYGLNQYYAAVNLEAQGTNPFATMYHEYYHSLTMPYFPELPIWLSEGLADFFGESQVNGTSRQWASRIPPHRRVAAQQSSYRSTCSSTWTLRRPITTRKIRVSVFYAESWALTHYLMIGDKQAHRQMLVDYAARCRQAELPDQAAAKAFGDLKKLQEIFRVTSANSRFPIFR